MSNDSKRLSQMGDHEYSCRNFESAYEYYKRAIEFQTENASLWNRRSVCAGKLGNLSDLEESYERAIILSNVGEKSEFIASYSTAKVEAYFDIICALRNSSTNHPIDDATKNDYLNSCESAARKIILARQELRSANRLEQVNDVDAIASMIAIFQIINEIVSMKGSFGPFERFWQLCIAHQLIPSCVNTAAWINFKSEKVIVECEWSVIND